MINFMVLASNATNIKDYFKVNSGGSIVIEHSYSSLSDNLSSIMNTTIRVDKFLIVFSESSPMNIKQEMTCLMDLIEKNSFFRISEILVYSEENDYCNSGLDYFKFVMNTLNFTNYTVKTYKDKITLQSLYRDTLSILPPDQERTSYNMVYRVRKGEESKVGYSPRLKDLAIYPVRPNGVKEYDKVKHNAIKSESGRIIKDKEPKAIENLDIDVHLFESNLSAIKNITLFVGTAKSGTSILCSKSFMQLEDCLLLDLSEGQGSVNTLSLLNSDDGLEFIDSKELMLGKVYESKGNKVLGSKDPNVALDLLKYILSIPNRLKFNKLIIDLDLSLLVEVVKVLQTRIHGMVFTSDVGSLEIMKLEPFLNKYEKYNRYLYLNECCSYPFIDKVNVLDLAKTFKDLKIIKGENLSDGSELDLGLFFE